HPTHPLAMKIVFGTQIRRSVRGKLVFSGDEVELVVVRVAAAFEPASGLAFISDKPVETHAQKSLKASLPRIVLAEMIFLECVGEDALRQILGVLVVSLPFQANVFVGWFPITGEDGVESAPAGELIVTAREDNGRVVSDRKLVKRAANIGIWIRNHWSLI